MCKHIFYFFIFFKMNTKKMLSSLLVVAFAFSFLLTGCDKKMDSYSDDDTMMEDGDKMMEDGDKMMEDGDKMMEDGDSMEAMDSEG